MVYYMSVITKLELIFLMTNSTDQDRILGHWSRNACADPVGGTIPPPACADPEGGQDPPPP